MRKRIGNSPCAAGTQPLQVPVGGCYPGVPAALRAMIGLGISRA